MKFTKNVIKTKEITRKSERPSVGTLDFGTSRFSSRINFSFSVFMDKFMRHLTKKYIQRHQFVVTENEKLIITVCNS